MSTHEYPRANILGVGISAINMELAILALDKWIEKKEKQYITVTGVQGLVESQRDENLRKIHNRAGLVTPDGMPLVWLCRLKGYQQVARVYGPDLMQAVCEQSLEKGYRNYFYGSGKGTSDLLREKLIARYPGLQVVGTYSPPFHALTPEEDRQIVNEINASQPDILWVGLGTPKQELWMAAHLGKVDASLMIGVGAAFDFLAGIKKQAPPWMRRSGLEWFFRLLTEPGRLWKRYLINNPLFIIFLIGQIFGINKYTMDE
jgi:N-acetylglucosaminyldiphosphoundecaprenol N-acetyl-beta-D-mannosaminyltransferase